MHIREWASLFLCLGFFGAMILIAKGAQVRDVGLIDAPQEIITITLTEDTELLGTFECYPGISLRTLLKNIPIEGNVKKRGRYSKKILYTSQTIEISEKSSF
ncbi:MAG: hypothetical protein KR126chlam1_00971 [Chlamydiae bacterium]|nr:hypothetical protein [Chlamydiota bacterium]